MLECHSDRIWALAAKIRQLRLKPPTLRYLIAVFF